MTEDGIWGGGHFGQNYSFIADVICERSLC